MIEEERRKGGRAEGGATMQFNCTERGEETDSTTGFSRLRRSGGVKNKEEKISVAAVRSFGLLLADSLPPQWGSFVNGDGGGGIPPYLRTEATVLFG